VKSNRRKVQVDAALAEHLEIWGGCGSTGWRPEVRAV
jgi:hypothetical protein